MEIAQLLQGAGLVGGSLLVLASWRSRGEDTEAAFYRLALAAPLVFLGGKAWFLAEHGLPPTLPNLLGPGYSLYGSLLLVLLFWTAWSWLQPFPLLRFLDTVTPAAALGLVFGRLSCYLRGCCSGLPTGSGWGVCLGPTAELFPLYASRGWTQSSLMQTIPLHPTQLYEAAFALAAFTLLWWAGKKGWREGRVFLSGALGYGLFRLVLEYWRIHPASPAGFGPVCAAQWASLAAIGLALFGLVGRGGIFRER